MLSNWLFFEITFEIFYIFSAHHVRSSWESRRGKNLYNIALRNRKIYQNSPLTSYEEYSKNVTINGKAINLKVWDTSGDELDRMRASFYHLANVFLVCYSIDLPNSFKDLKLKWISEISNHNPNIPLILLGTKSDLRSNKLTIEKLKKNKQIPVFYKDGVRLAKQIGASKYLECSALEQNEVNEVFEESIHFVLNPTPPIPQKKVFL